MFNEYGIQLGILDIRWYAVIIMTGALIALYFIQREGNKVFNIETEVIFDLFFVMMITGFLGARIYYVLFNLDYYLANPTKIIAIYEGGLAIYGGIIGGAIGIYFHCKKYKLNYLLSLDIIIPFLILAQSIGRWGNFVNKEAHGGVLPGVNSAEQVAFLKQFFIPDFIIERMKINGVYYHPTFLYESIWCLIGFVLLYFVVKRWKNLKLGMITACYFIWYGVGRFFIEGMRTDSLYLFDVIRISQLVSVIGIMGGIYGLYYIQKHKNIPEYKKANFYLKENKKEQNL